MAESITDEPQTDEERIRLTTPLMRHVVKEIGSYLTPNAIKDLIPGEELISQVYYHRRDEDTTEHWKLTHAKILFYSKSIDNKDWVVASDDVLLELEDTSIAHHGEPGPAKLFAEAVLTTGHILARVIEKTNPDR